MDNKLDEGLKIKCQWCLKTNTLKEWDRVTFAECVSREMRRAYMHLTDHRAFRREAEKFYKCPDCGQWLRGSQLLIETEDQHLKKLGGEPIISVLKKINGGTE